MRNGSCVKQLPKPLKNFNPTGFTGGVSFTCYECTQSSRLRSAAELKELEFLAYCQQEDTDNNNGNKGVGFPGKLFFQENTGE